MQKTRLFITVFLLVIMLGCFSVNAAVTEQKLYEFNFENLSAGTTLPSEFTWNNTGSAKIVDLEGNKVLELAGPGYNFIFIGDNIEGDFVIELKMKITNHLAKGSGQFTFREDKTKNNARYGYHVCFGDCRDEQFGVELRKRVLNDFSEMVTNHMDNDGQWHQFRAEVVGSNVKLFMDGNKLADQTMTGYDSGWITVSTYLDTVLFDDIKVSRLVEVETEPETNPTTGDSGVMAFVVLSVCLAAVVLVKKRVVA